MRVAGSDHVCKSASTFLPTTCPKVLPICQSLWLKCYLGVRLLLFLSFSVFSSGFVMHDYVWLCVSSAYMYVFSVSVFIQLEFNYTFGTEISTVNAASLSFLQSACEFMIFFLVKVFSFFSVNKYIETMCLMGRKAVSHPCSHKGENIKCSKNNHQHLMYMRSLSRWERRNLSHFRLSCAWYRKLPIVCESQTDRESIRSLLLISYSVYCSEQCILFYSGVVLLDSLCQPMHRVQSRHGRVTRSSQADRWATARPLPSLCPIHGCTQTFLGAGLAPSCWFCVLSATAWEVGKCTRAPSSDCFSLIHVVLSGTSIDFEREGMLVTWFCLQLLRWFSLNLSVRPLFIKSLKSLSFVKIFMQILILPVL